MSDCIFCGIAAGTMPSERVHEDERTVAFLDIFPATDGHVLVIPRAHADDIHSLDPADVAAVAQTAQLMAGRVSGGIGILREQRRILRRTIVIHIIYIATAVGSEYKPFCLDAA